MEIPALDSSSAVIADMLIARLSAYLRSNPGRSRLVKKIELFKQLEISQSYIVVDLAFSPLKKSGEIITAESLQILSLEDQPSPYSS